MKKSLILLWYTMIFVSCGDKELPAPIISIAAPKELTANSLADGKTQYQFTVTIDAQSKDEYKLVTVTCTDGKFVGEGEAKTRQVRVNEQGISDDIFWIVPKKSGTYYLSATIGKDPDLHKAEVKVELKDEVKVSTTISVTPDEVELSDATANGQDLVTIDITIDNGKTNSFLVSTNEGYLSDGLMPEGKSVTLKANSSGNTSAILRLANNVTRYSIKAERAENDSIYKVISFTPKRAYANDIIIEPSSVKPEIGQPVDLSIFLKRDKGLVSTGTSISIRAYQIVNGVEKSVGRFTGLENAKTNTNQEISVKFQTDTNDFDKDLTKKVIIEVGTKNQNEQIFTRNTSIALSAI